MALDPELVYLQLKTKRKGSALKIILFVFSHFYKKISPQNVQIGMTNHILSAKSKHQKSQQT